MLTRRGNWMQTYTGRAFYPLDPRPEDVDPIDVAHALSRTCRYGGHVRRFYSVAEHCVLMASMVPPEDALAALLHDATEAYCGDLIRPLKLMMPDFAAMEASLWLAVCERFQVDITLPDSVKDADNRILLDERAAMLGPVPLPWSQDLERLQPLGVTVSGWAPYRAKAEYLSNLEKLRK